MIADLKPYPAYKDSGVPWLGKVPSTWVIARNGGLFTQRNETGFAHLPILEVSLKTGVQVRNFDGSGRKQVMSDRDMYKRARKGDIAYNMMRMWQGAIGMAPTNGLVSPAYVVARPLRGVEPRFFLYLFRTDAYMGEVDKFSHGIVKDRNRLYWEDFKQMPSPVPTPDEQAAIVRFLDHADRQIRQYIRAKQKLIELLEEQKQAIIHRAVTRGLDPNVRLKPSGVEWLGDVPEHWSVGRIKLEMHNLNTRRVPLSAPDRGKMMARQYDYYGASGVIDKVDDYLFNDELLLIAEDGANLVLRNLPLAIIARGKFWVNNHAHILKPKRGSLEYFGALLECLDYTAWITGAAQPKLTQDRLMAMRIPVPPSTEQDLIISWIESNTGYLKVGTLKARKEIELLREYRTRLIADVVTGKLDVRAAAANLPDETSESESLDADESLVEAEGDTDNEDVDEEPEETEV